MPTKIGRLEYGESSCGSTADSDAFTLEYQGGAMGNGWCPQNYGYNEGCVANPQNPKRQGPWKANMTLEGQRPNIDQMSSWRQQEEEQHGISVLDACREINKQAREDEVLALRLKLEKRQAALEAKAKRLGMQGIQRSGRGVRSCSCLAFSSSVLAESSLHSKGIKFIVLTSENKCR